MNKKMMLVKVLSGMELMCAFVILAGCICLYRAGMRFVDSSALEPVAQSIEEYAVVVEMHRRTIDMAGKDLPAYAAAMRECAAMLNGEILEASREAEKIASGQQEYDDPLLNILVRLSPQRSLQLSQELNRSLPEVAEVMKKGAETLEEHTPEKHQQMMAAVDKTADALRRIAADVRNIQRGVKTAGRILLICGAFLAAGMALNAVMFILILCSRNRQ